MSARPHFGFSHGLAVHLRTADYHRGGLNKAIAAGLTKQVGSMRMFWYFNVLSLLSLPATLVLVGLFAAPKSGPLHFFLTFGWIYLITWICQNYIQLVLLPALMVGQNLQNEASDARSAKQFEDTEQIMTDVAAIKVALTEQPVVINVSAQPDTATLAREVQRSLIQLRRQNGGRSGGF